MNYYFSLLAAGAMTGCLMVSGTGCNTTTRDDVTSAQQSVNEAQQKLEETRREGVQNVNEERREANEARATNKPVVGDDINEGPAEERREVVEAKRDAENREARQQEKVSEAKADLEQTKDKLSAQVQRDKFVADARLQIDAANRAIEKLEAKRPAADEKGKTDLDNRIKEIQRRRDFLKEKIDAVESADVPRWSEHQADVKKAIQELEVEVRNVT